MGSNETVLVLEPVIESVQTATADMQVHEDTDISYRRADGTVEHARSAEDAIARCPVLGKLAIEAPDQANILLGLAAAGRKKMAAAEDSPRPRPVENVEVKPPRAKKGAVFVPAAAVIDKKAETRRPHIDSDHTLQPATPRVPEIPTTIADDRRHVAPAAAEREAEIDEQRIRLPRTVADAHSIETAAPRRMMHSEAVVLSRTIPEKIEQLVRTKGATVRPILIEPLSVADAVSEVDTKTEARRGTLVGATIAADTEPLMLDNVYEVEGFKMPFDGQAVDNKADNKALIDRIPIYVAADTDKTAESLFLFEPETVGQYHKQASLAAGMENDETITLEDTEQQAGGLSEALSPPQPIQNEALSERSPDPNTDNEPLLDLLYEAETVDTYQRLETLTLAAEPDDKAPLVQQLATETLAAEPDEPGETLSPPQPIQNEALSERSPDPNTDNEPLLDLLYEAETVDTYQRLETLTLAAEPDEPGEPAAPEPYGQQDDAPLVADPDEVTANQTVFLDQELRVCASPGAICDSPLSPYASTAPVARLLCIPNSTKDVTPADFEDFISSQPQIAESVTLEAITEAASETPLEQSLVLLAECLAEPSDTPEYIAWRQMIWQIGSALPARGAAPGEAEMPAVHITPEMTDNLLSLLRALGYQQPGDTLVDLVSRSGEIFLFDALEYVCKRAGDDRHEIPLGSTFTSVNDDEDTKLRLGKVLFWLIARTGSAYSVSM